MAVTASQRLPVLGAPDYPPQPWLALWFFAQIFYAIMGTVLGLSIQLAGVGMLLLLGAVCVARSGPYSSTILRAMILPLGLALSYIVIQVMVHGQSLRDTEAVRAFINWMVSLFVLYYLSLRPGFFHQFAFAIFLIGVSTLPYLRSFQQDMSRTAVDHNIAISNPNDLGAWFGFCALYFLILGIETRRHWIRVLSSTTGVACLLVVGLTGSRGPLFALACGLTVAFRRVLKRGFLPFLALIVFAWIGYGLGLFDQAAALYAERGLQETGRFLVWPIALARFAHAPFTGVGIRDIATFIPSAQAYATPHNGVIQLALVSGIVPVTFFLAYWIQLARGVLKPAPEIAADAPFLLPLLLYAFLIMLNLNEAYKDAWMLAVFSGVGRGVLSNTTRAVAVRRWRRLGLLPEVGAPLGVKTQSTA